MLEEFKAFAVKGNVVDMAVGIIVGAAFGKIVSSLVEDVIMPPIGMLIGGVNFSDLAITLQEATAGAAAVTVKYGKFLQTVIDFTIIAFAIFMAVKAISSMKKKEEAAPAAPAAPPAPSAEERLLTEIRDLLQAK
ncbi:MAG: large-conductance mechanosensitive channel protein MscL [Gammaproteobacteria bacterium]|nr:large-conductance mechanosensitive channel protein MscL [Gammaproteobacteria bacterium]